MDNIAVCRSDHWELTAMVVMLRSLQIGDIKPISSCFVSQSIENSILMLRMVTFQEKLVVRGKQLF